MPALSDSAAVVEIELDSSPALYTYVVYVVRLRLRGKQRRVQRAMSVFKVQLVCAVQQSSR